MKVKKHGGKREGSGRPKGEETQTVSFRLKINQIEPVKELVRNYLKYHFKDNPNSLTQPK